ncbi:MAG: hypothetical protein AAFX01_11840 [Cyanobacteria bacterium J06638_28]
MEFLNKRVSFPLRLLQWTALVVTGGAFFLAVTQGAVLLAIAASLIFLALYPRSLGAQFVPQQRLRFRTPVLMVGLTLFMVGCGLGSGASVAVCQSPVDGQCADHESTLDAGQLQTAYAVAELPSDVDASEAVLELNYTSEGGESEVVYTASQAVGETVQFELPLNDLPIGKYTAKMSAGDTSTEEDFELTGDPPRLNELALCGELDQSTCATNYTLYLADVFNKVYVSAQPQHVRSETPIEVAVNYSPHPGVTELLNTVSGVVQAGDSAFITEVPLPSFKVGTYDVTITSPKAKDFLTQTETFTVWHNNEAISERAEGTLSDATTQISDFKLCEQELSSEELTEIEADPDNDEITDIDDSDRCPADNTTFASGVQTLAVDVGIGADFAREEIIDLTFVWRYLQGPGGGEQELHTKTIPLEPDLSTFVYTLTGPDGGYPAGTYEVLVYLETDTSQPIRREFVVQ